MNNVNRIVNSIVKKKQMVSSLDFDNIETFEFDGVVWVSGYELLKIGFSPDRLKKWRDGRGGAFKYSLRWKMIHKKTYVYSFDDIKYLVSELIDHEKLRVLLKQEKEKNNL